MQQYQSAADRATPPGETAENTPAKGGWRESLRLGARPAAQPRFEVVSLFLRGYLRQVNMDDAA
jgi:hypothetical protein